MKQHILALLAFTVLGGLPAKSQKDITSDYITNAALSQGTTGWTVKNFNNPVLGPNSGAYAVEAYAGWSSLSVTSYSLTQKIKLPKGSYRLTNNAFFRYGEKFDTNASKSQAYLKAGTKRVAVKTLGSVTADTYPNNQTDGANCLGGDNYLNTVDFEVTTDNATVEIGITGTFDQMRSWCITSGFQLTDLNAKDDRKGLLTALERFENDYNLTDGTDYRRLTMSAEAWSTLIKLVNDVSLALDDNTRAEEYSDLRDTLNAQLDATDASISLFNDYQATVERVRTLVGASASLPVYNSDTNTDATLRTAIDRLNNYAANYNGGYMAYLTAARGFTEVTSVEDIITGGDYCYILTAAESAAFFVGIGSYEEKPDWAGEDTKALRYRQAGDPLADISNFFTIEKEGDYIGLRNILYHTSLFQTHDNAGFMYVLTYTEPTMSDWCYLRPTYQEGYWLFESGKYPVASDNWACGYLGPWNKVVADGEPIALNRRNTTGDEAGHYRIFRIKRTDLFAQQQTITGTKPADMTWKIANPSFETGDETGWTLYGKDPEGNDEFMVRGDYSMTNMQGQYLMNAYQWWAQSLSVGQTVTGLPAGEYTLSAVVATWEGRTVTLSANVPGASSAKSTTISGKGDQTGISVSLPVTIGTGGRMTINCESTAQWWVEGHESETQTFFKLDNVRLKCRKLFLDGMAVPLPNNETPLVPGQWYYYETDINTEYLLIGSLASIVYTFDGTASGSIPAGNAVMSKMSLPVGRTYFKVKEDAYVGSIPATLVIMPYRDLEEGTFTAVALNVDGLPNTVANRELNPDGPGSDGTKKISQYLASKGYDLIGCSEDFNYHGSLISALMDNYSWGTVRATISVGDLPWSQIIQGKIRFDTDGLNLIWKNSTMAATNESWTQWNSLSDTEGNQYVKKGFRHYDLWLSAKAVIDVYVLHMDAGDDETTWARHSQWEQLAEAINGSDHSRAKLIMGDTNSRWTREDISTHFTNLLSNDFTMNDVWVELWRKGIYPTTDMGDLYDVTIPDDYSRYEIVDKIIYLNPAADNTVQLKPQEFRIEQDYTYDYVDHNGNTQPLGDHKPVVVTFKYHLIGEAPEPVVGDVNGDRTVDVADIASIISVMASVGADPVSPRFADVNSDGTVDVADIASVISIMAAK